MNWRFVTLLLCVGFLGCHTTKTDLVGLWEITQVRAGKQTMTPNARWVRFGDDGRQQSGNGWLQHSIGSYTVKSSDSLLQIETTNGTNDEFGDFKYIFLDEKQMIWQRWEEDMMVEISLKKVEELPASHKDQAFGLWKLIAEDGVSTHLSADGFTHLYLRWDGRYFMYTSGSRLNGVYNVHAHQPELEIIPYASAVGRSWWQFSQESDTLSLRLLNIDDKVGKTFIRTNSFPEE